MKRGLRFVHGDKELVEKLGRNDSCPCGSGSSFQTVLPPIGLLSMGPSGTIIGGSEFMGLAAVSPECLLPPNSGHTSLPLSGAQRWTMLRLSVFKPIDWRTSSLEVWNDDRLVAEVFARADGVRRLYVSDETAERGIEWDDLIEAAPKITAMLDAADAERRANGS